MKVNGFARVGTLAGTRLELSGRNELPLAHARGSAVACCREGPIYFCKSEVQCGQRIALIGIELAQKGQSLVAGAASAAAAGFVNLFDHWTIRNTKKATIRKLMMVLRNCP